MIPFEVQEDFECVACQQLGTVGGLDLCVACLGLQVDDDIVSGTVTFNQEELNEQLLVPLTEEELLEYGHELSSTIVGKGKMEAERAVLNKKMKPLAERIETLAPIIDAEEETRKVDCRMAYQWDRGRKILSRNDTGDIVSILEIQDWEKQQHMDLSVAAAGSTEKEPAEDTLDDAETMEDGCPEETTDDEPLWTKALALIVEENQASVSMLQRNLRIGYNRAAGMIETLEEAGYIGPSDGTIKPREVFADVIAQAKATTTDDQQTEEVEETAESCQDQGRF